MAGGPVRAWAAALSLALSALSASDAFAIGNPTSALARATRLPASSLAWSTCRAALGSAARPFGCRAAQSLKPNRLLRHSGMAVSCTASSEDFATEMQSVGVKEWFEQNGIKIKTFNNLGGSSWSSTHKYIGEDGTEYFVKKASQKCESMFQGEALGLLAMYHAGALRIPKVFAYGNDPKGGSYVIMEYLPLGGGRDQLELGRAMAKMHLAEPMHQEARDGKFGFPVDNTIGGTPQPNKWDDNWVRFFRDQRIGHQVKLAGDGTLDNLWEKVLEKTNNLEDLFQGITVKPVVLHGDLWSGNIASADGKPTIYDPATYYGHHEAEWGMSWCAGFGPKFWEGYREFIPEDEGFKKRYDLYELYHILNHYNLFGGGYRNQAAGLMERLLK